jgi:hypothetical protein
MKTLPTLPHALLLVGLLLVALGVKGVVRVMNALDVGPIQ